jgi:hypothetical protein
VFALATARNVFKSRLQKQNEKTLFRAGKPRDIKDFARFLEAAPCKCRLHSRKLAFGGNEGSEARSKAGKHGVTDKSNSEVGRCDARQ